MIERFNIYADDSGPTVEEPHELGLYVLYTDHIAELANLTKRMEVVVEALEMCSGSTHVNCRDDAFQISREALAKLRSMK